MRLINADVLVRYGCRVNGSHSAREVLDMMREQENRNTLWMTEEEVIELIRNAKVIDASLNRRAMWEQIDDDEDETVWRCSYCGNEQIVDHGDLCHKYCEECGSIMDNGAEYQSDECFFTNAKDTYEGIRIAKTLSKD